MLLQDSFYHNLTEGDIQIAHEYNFDHPGNYFYNAMLY